MVVGLVGESIAPAWVLGAGIVLAEEGLPLPPSGAGLPLHTMPVPELAGHAHAIMLEPQGLHTACDPRADGVPIRD